MESARPSTTAAMAMARATNPATPLFLPLGWTQLALFVGGSRAEAHHGVYR